MRDEKGTHALRFVYEPEPAKAAVNLAERLTAELKAGKQVLWLVPGGSNILLSTGIVKSLPTDLLSQLNCLLTDERYGIPGHADSNWQQLADAGFMLADLSFPPVLRSELTIEDTCTEYAATATAAMDAADLIIGQFGIGGDGHIAGILPHTVAVTDDKQVVGYDSGAFQRITLTPPMLRRLDAAYAYVYGETKHDALQRLHDKELPLADQPSQILKELPEAYVYTDQKIEGIESIETIKGEAA